SVGSLDASDVAKLRAYPNPVREGEPVYLLLDGGEANGDGQASGAPTLGSEAWISVYNVDGTLVLRQRMASSRPAVTLTKQGIYLILVNNQVVKVVVR
ncbi:MAG: hypothetical protein LBF67_02085, partial [Prevotellaceae bacterium]|nr:hypothetical protein [Prevotellaceae bacterium]